MTERAKQRKKAQDLGNSSHALRMTGGPAFLDVSVRHTRRAAFPPSRVKPRFMMTRNRNSNRNRVTRNRMVAAARTLGRTAVRSERRSFRPSLDYEQEQEQEQERKALHRNWGTRSAPRAGFACGEMHRRPAAENLTKAAPDSDTTGQRQEGRHSLESGRFDFTGRRFVCYLPRAEVAQLVEQRTENPRVASSILALGTIFLGWSSSVGRARHS